MRKIKIITDSGVDLPKSMMKERGIDIVPAQIMLGPESYPDDGSVDPKKLFDFAKKTGTMPKIVESSAFQIQEIFQKWMAEDYDVFFTCASSKLSPTAQNALIAMKKLAPDRISVVDSMSVSSGIGLQALEACDLAERGASLLEITNHLYSIRTKVRASMVLDTLKYVYIGGRCSRLTSIMADTFNIKATIDIVDGDMVPGENLRGNNYLDKYLKKAMENPERIDPKRIFVTHCLADEAEEIKERITKDYGFTNIIISEASLGVSMNCGPGGLGIMYRYK